MSEMLPTLDDKTAVVVTKLFNHQNHDISKTLTSTFVTSCRWGEKYDGHGGSTKYTDKWAERSEGDGWTKWGDKWDEDFDPNGHGVKQGETWWAGKFGERWNRTWGEHHNGSGWIHKYGKSSCGEHWDTHVQQETWYERFPHFGFYHCYDNSVQLREVPKPSDMP